MPNINFETIKHSFGFFTQEHFSFALALVLFVSGILFIVSRFERPIFFEVKNSQLITDRRVYRILFLCFILVLIALIAGEIGYMGIQYDKDTKRISLLSSIAFLISPIILPFISFIYQKERAKNKKILLFFYFLFFLTLVIVFGRRILLFSILLIVVTYQFSRNKQKQKSRNIGKFLLSIVLFGAGIFVLFWGFRFFYAIRLTANVANENQSLIDQVKSAFELVGSSSNFVENKYIENIIERPFFSISYLSTLVAALSDHSILFGKELVNSFMIAIPSSIFPTKIGLVAGTPEELVHPLLGMAVFDGTNTIITSGLDDFGPIGAVIYPLVLVSVYILIIKLAKNRLPFPIILLIAFSLIYNILSVETGLAGLITSSLRNLCIFVIGCLFVWSLPPINFLIGNGYIRKIRKRSFRMSCDSQSKNIC